MRYTVHMPYPVYKLSTLRGRAKDGNYSDPPIGGAYIDYQQWYDRQGFYFTPYKMKGYYIARLTMPHVRGIIQFFRLLDQQDNGYTPIRIKDKDGFDILADIL